MSAWIQKDLREVSPHLTHRTGFLKVLLCPEMKCQIGVLIVIINIYLMHTMLQPLTREFISSVIFTVTLGSR